MNEIEIHVILDKIKKLFPLTSEEILSLAERMLRESGMSYGECISAVEDIRINSVYRTFVLKDLKKYLTQAKEPGDKHGQWVECCYFHPDNPRYTCGRVMVFVERLYTLESALEQCRAFLCSREARGLNPYDYKVYVGTESLSQYYRDLEEAKKIHSIPAGK